MKLPSHARSIPLSELLAGHCARVASVAGKPDHVHQLAEFGLRRGARIEMFRRGNPCILRLAGHKVCLRGDDLLHVLVEPIPAARPPAAAP